QKLVDDNASLWNHDSETSTLHKRNISYAIAVNEWYRSTDPSRLLTLAREANVSIDGHDWASPKLLSGRLALSLLSRQYGAEREIGRQRLRQIESMVNNWASGSKDAGPIEMIFYIAVHSQELRVARNPDNVLAKASWADKLANAYRAAVREREDMVHQAGLPIVQDLHLLDAEERPAQTEPAPSVTAYKERGDHGYVQ
ncbi:MAG: hypothetical protein AB8B63_20980, partial [Granulosicoccus sp.]